MSQPETQISEQRTAQPQVVETPISSDDLAKFYTWLCLGRDNESASIHPSADVLTRQNKMLQWIGQELVQRGDEALIEEEALAGNGRIITP